VITAVGPSDADQAGTGRSGLGGDGGGTASKRRCRRTFEFGYGPLTRFVTWWPLFTASPVLLMTWEIVPTPPSDTVTMLWNFTPEVTGTSKARALTTELLALKKQ
jgi:hypothetical protein